MTTIPPRQVDETLTRAREAVLDPECSPSDVERLLGEAVDELGALGVDSSAVQRHLNKHEQVTGESGFPPETSRRCRDALRRVHGRLRDRFEAVPEPGCLSCGAPIQGTERDLCEECRDSGSGADETREATNGGNVTEADVSNSSHIIIGGEGNETHDH